MKISLRNIPSFCLSCEKSKERWPLIEIMFQSIGWNTKIVNGEITDPYTIGVAKSHRQTLETPGHVLILEDDARKSWEFPDDISFDDSTDAIYLGASAYGRENNNTIYGAVKVSEYSQDLMKAHNMLGMHAILYLSERYKTFVREHLVNFINNPYGGCDDFLAENMNNFNILCAKRPYFFQADGHSEAATLISF